MADESFSIEVDDSRVTALLQALDRKLSDLRPVFEEIGELLKTSIVKNFEVGGRYREIGGWRGGSRKWQPLSVATLFSRKKSFYVGKRGKFKKRAVEFLQNRQILIREGHLMDSINWRAGRESVEVGTNVVYAAIHQFGGKAGRGKKVAIPARPYMVVQEEDLDQINSIIQEHLLGVSQ